MLAAVCVIFFFTTKLGLDIGIWTDLAIRSGLPKTTNEAINFLKTRTKI
jgi:hypothetical protein